MAKHEMNRRLKGKIISEYGTQFLFSVALGINQSEVSRAVRGRLTLTNAEKKQWAKCLGVPVKKLFPEGQNNG